MCWSPLEGSSIVVEIVGVGKGGLRAGPPQSGVAPVWVSTAGLKQNMFFDEAKATWNWQYDEEVFYLNVRDLIRVRVRSVTTNSTGEMVVDATIDESGLGAISWW